MRGTDLAKAYAAIVRQRSDVTLKEGIELLRIAFGEPTLSEKRARAGGAGGKRSAAVRGEKHGTAQPRSRARSTFEAGAEPSPEATPKQSAFASTGPAAPDAPPLGSPLHPPPDPTPGNPKEFAVVAKGSDRFSRELVAATAAVFDDSELAEWLDRPLAERAALVLADSKLANDVAPQTWDEVDRIWVAWHSARGGDGTFPLLGLPKLDRNTEAILKMFAAGWSVTDLVLAVGRLPKSEKYRDRALLWSVLTPDVVSIELDAAKREHKRQASARGPRPAVVADVVPYRPSAAELAAMRDEAGITKRTAGAAE